MQIAPCVTHLLTYAKFARMQKLEKFAPASDQVQISFCVYANFAYMQIWSCERKAKLAHVSYLFNSDK